MKNEQPPDDDLPPSGEAIQQIANPNNPPLYHDALAGLITTQHQGIHVSYINDEESRKQLPAVEQVLVQRAHAQHAHSYLHNMHTQHTPLTTEYH